MRTRRRSKTQMVKSTKNQNRQKVGKHRRFCTFLPIGILPNCFKKYLIGNDRTAIPWGEAPAASSGRWGGGWWSGLRPCPLPGAFHGPPTGAGVFFERAFDDRNSFFPPDVFQDFMIAKVMHLVLAKKIQNFTEAVLFCHFQHMFDFVDASDPPKMEKPQHLHLQISSSTNQNKKVFNIHIFSYKNMPEFPLSRPQRVLLMVRLHDTNSIFFDVKHW